MIGNTFIPSFHALRRRPAELSVWVEDAEWCRAVGHLPGSVVGLLDADRLADQRRGQIDEPTAPFDLAALADPAHRGAGCVIRRGEPSAPAPRRAPVDGGRRRKAQRLMWPVLIVDLPEARQALALAAQRRGRRVCGFRLQRPVQPLQPAVLLRAGRLDPLRYDARPDEPHA